jgi:F-type H+-transporting ATPase subunit b
MANLMIFVAAPGEAGTHEGAHTSTEAHGGTVEHAEPTALGLSATVWVSLAMLLLIAVMVWKKVPAIVSKMLDDKIAGIRAQLDEAAALRTEAEALRNEYAAKLAALDGETAAIKARAEEEAAALVAKTEADAKDLIARRQRMADDRIGAAERAAVADVREQATRAAVVAATGLIAEKHDGKADQVLVDRAIADLGRA